MKILIVDDVASNRKVLELLLAKYGDCVSVEDGPAAILEFSKAYNAGKPFNLIFLDALMPHMDGEATLKSIRAFEKECGLLGTDFVDVVCVTTLDVKRELAGILADPKVILAQKPVSSEQITKVIEKIFSKK